MRKQFKKPKYLVQIDIKYCTKDVTKIWNYEMSFIKNVEYITYHSHQYSYKMKDDIMMESFAKFNEFDKIFNDEVEVNKYLKNFETNFEQYRKKICCKVAYNNLLMKKNNIDNGLSDVRYFSKISDNWRHS